MEVARGAVAKKPGGRVAKLRGAAIGWTVLAGAAEAAALTSEPARDRDGEGAWLLLVLIGGWLAGLTLLVLLARWRVTSADTAGRLGLPRRTRRATERDPSVGPPGTRVSRAAKLDSGRARDRASGK